jgi:hypothetical protein
MYIKEIRNTYLILVGKPQSNNWPDIHWRRILKYVLETNFEMRSLLNFFITGFYGWLFKKILINFHLS